MRAALNAAASDREAGADRLASLSWDVIAESLDTVGYATAPGLLDGEACRDLIDLYDDSARFRSRVVMQRHAFGSGEYQYFDHPLPPIVTELRRAAYPHLAAIAKRWDQALGLAADYPETLDGYLARCHEAGQTRPTPLLLKYRPGDYNRLHRDLYGELVFPLQMAILLSAPARDFAGGEFILVEQRPRSQSRAEVVPLARGDAVIFPVHHRPAKGTRGVYRLAMRHGVSRVSAGERFCLGIIFHDAA